MRLYEGPRVRKIYFQLRSLSSKRVGRLHFNKVQSMYLKIIQKVSLYTLLLIPQRILKTHLSLEKIRQIATPEGINIVI